MKTRVKRLLRTSVDRLTRIDRVSAPLEDALRLSDRRLRMVADSALRTRFMVRRHRNDPIRVALLCHSPSLWGMFDSLYWEATNDPMFEIVVVATPYTRNPLSREFAANEDMYEFLASRGVNVVRGRFEEAVEWPMPEALNAHYVMFQTPYSFYPPEWSAPQVSLIARICHIDYGTILFRDDVEAIVHPEAFFRHVSLICAENDESVESLTARFSKCAWFLEKTIQEVGYPKLDYLRDNRPHDDDPGAEGSVWPREAKAEVTRVLWTPRWTTAEGASHFLDYADHFIEFAHTHDRVDLVFRPHPLAFQNLLATGELSETEASRLEAAYNGGPNMAIDRSGDYRDTFLTSDILITDMSSLMLEYLATAKPIIYTHRVDLFNQLGRQLSEAFYWVRSKPELEATLAALMAGNDPLLEKRQEIAAALRGTNTKSSGRRILDAIVSDADTAR